MRFLKKWPRLHLPVQVVVCTLCFGLTLPVSIALFPQNSEVTEQSCGGSMYSVPTPLSSLQIAVSDLEPEFREKTNRTTLVYNKGL